jgi:hypothetical protein
MTVGLAFSVAFDRFQMQVAAWSSTAPKVIPETLHTD